MAHETETLPNGTVVWTDAHHRVGTDALLLSRFCSVKPGMCACDLGTGCGILLLGLIDRGLTGRALALEQDEAACELLRGAAAQNGLPGLEAVQGDLRRYRSSRKFDLVVANPPYFRQGQPSPDAVRAAARHEESCSLAELCAAAAGLAKDGGKFCLCYPPRRLAGLFGALGENRFAPKRLQLVRKEAAAEPWLALVEARMNGGEGLAIEPDILLEAGKPIAY